MADGAQHQRTEFDGADITKVIAERSNRVLGVRRVSPVMTA
jgi:hypothetical protein